MSYFHEITVLNKITAIITRFETRITAVANGCGYLVYAVLNFEFCDCKFCLCH